MAGAGAGFAAAVESGDRTQRGFWTCLDPLWVGTVPLSPQRFSVSRFICPQGRFATATLDGGDVSNARSRSARTRGFQYQLPEDLLRGVLTKGGRRWPDISSRHDSGGENRWCGSLRASSSTAGSTAGQSAYRPTDSGALIFNNAPSRALRFPGARKSQRCGKTVTHSRTQRVALRSEDSAISSVTNKSFRIPIAHPILSLRSFSRIPGGWLDRGG